MLLLVLELRPHAFWALFTIKDASFFCYKVVSFCAILQNEIFNSIFSQLFKAGFFVVGY